MSCLYLVHARICKSFRFPENYHQIELVKNLPVFKGIMERFIFREYCKNTQKRDSTEVGNHFRDNLSCIRFVCTKQNIYIKSI